MLVQLGYRQMRTLTAYWLNKSLALIAAALLIGLALTQIARYTMRGGHGAADHGEVKVDAMGRGGQFEKAQLW
jgi:hypothetical protein